MKEIYKYNNTNEYLKFIRDNFRPIKTIPMAGTLIQFNYFFFLNPLYKKYPEKKKYLDFFPLDIILAIRPKKKLMMCVNLHALPVPTRQILLGRLKKTYPQSFNDEKPRILMPGMNYKKMLRYLKKIGVAIRTYRFERIRHLSIVPPECIDTVVKFYTNTYYKTNYQGVVSRYNNYKPPKT